MSAKSKPKDLLQPILALATVLVLLLGTGAGAWAANDVSWQLASTGLPSTGYAMAIAFGDYNNDGTADLFAAIAGGGIKLWANDGTPAWSDKTSSSLPTTGKWYGLAAADLNHDGRLDIAAAGDGVGVRAYVQDGTGGWDEVILDSAGSFYEVAVGDVNNDGNPDIVAANHSTSGYGLPVWIGDGSGYKWSFFNSPDTSGPYWGLALADFNYDGYLDIAAGKDTADGGVYVWAGNGGGSWYEADTGLPDGSGTWRDVAFGDFDNDGKLDLVATSSKGLGLWTGDGAGSWTAAADGLPTSGDYAGLITGDLDNDGRLDLVAVRIDDGGIEPWQNPGSPWTPFAQPDDAASWWNVALADVDNDGILDLGATSQSDQGVQVWVDSGTGEPAGTWVEIASPADSGSPRALAAADLNWDGDLDIVAAMGSDAGLRAWTGDGGNTWSDCSPNLPSSGTYYALALGQLTGYAYPELIAGGDSGIETYLNEGCYWNLFSSGLPTTGSYHALALGDIDHDGKPDLVGAEWGGGLPIWEYDSGTWTPVYSPTNTSTYYDVALGDLNHDGELDIAAANYAGLGVRVWLYDGPSSWTASVVTSTGEYDAIALGDLNNDGHLDIAAAKNGATDQQGIFLWLGDGTGSSWTPFPSPVTTGQYFDLDLADFNHDGFLDLLAARDGYGVDVWAGDGAGNWTESSTNLPTSGAFYAARFGHIDHDGFPDLLTTQYTGGIRLWTAAEATPPGDWANFTPYPWVTTQTVTCTVQVVDTTSGLDVSSAQYAYSTDGGASWSSWLSATVSGSDGVTTTQTMTATAVPFGQDSGTTHQNRIKFRIADMAGNVGESPVYNVDIDTTPPTNPTTLSGDRSTSTWSNDATVMMTWSGASDASSGVQGYSYQWSTSSDTVPDETIDTTATSVPTVIPGDGQNWYFHVRARDRAGHWAAGATHQGPYWLDTTPPDNPDAFYSTSHTPGTWSQDNTVTVVWSGASDGDGSGVYGYSYQWSTSSTTLPDTTVDTTNSSVTSSPLSDSSNWYFHIRTRDQVGNWNSSAAHYGPFRIDTTPPSSHASSPYSVSSRTFTVSWSGSDTGSGIASYDVQYRDTTLGTGWMLWKSYTTSTSDTFTGQHGHVYQFRSRARDHVGNVEAWPSTPDSTTRIATVDFEGFALEVTQGIQDLNNSVVLVAHKRTFARFHVRSLAHGDRGPVSAHLSAWRGGTYLGTILPNNPGGTITIRQDPDRGQLEHSFYFDLPSSWLHSSVTLIAEVNHDHRMAESDYSNNYQTASVTFQDTPEMNILLVDACYTSGGTTYHVRNTDRWALASWLRRAYPIHRLNVWWGVFVPCYDSLPNASDVNSDLVWNKSRNVLGDDEDPYTRYYGMADDGGGFMRGRAYDIPSTVASGPAGSGTWGWDFDGSYADWYGGHELGHTYGRYHAEFCGAGGGKPYPYPNGDISPTRDESDPDALYGFDVETLDIYPPSWKDLMSYCDNIWLSDFTYEGIRDRMLTESALAAAWVRPAATQEYLAVFGTIYTATDQVELDTFYRVPDAWDVLGRTPGEYSIRLLDEEGSTLADYPFTPRFSDLDPSPSLQVGMEAEEEPALIAEYVPWVTGTARIAIYHGTQELVARSVSANAPQVTLTYPNGGEVLNGSQITVTWEASDADGDALNYTLEYSVDGGAHWRALGSGITTTHLTIDAAFVPGTDQGKFRILASDGVNTAQDESDGTFTVPNKAPEVQIVSPSDGAIYMPEQSVALIATAIDLEDGTLGDAALSWTSSLSGAVGTGQMLHVTDFITGTHVITLTATDSDGQQTSATVTIYITKLDKHIYLPVILKQ